MTYPVRTVLWFNGRGREAAAFYCGLIPGSRVETSFSGDGGGGFEVIDFNLGGIPYQILDAGPYFTLSECVSIMVQTPDQSETDRLWDTLIAGGGSPSRCGWLKDRFGLSWQIIPAAVMRLVGGPDAAVAARAHQAVMTMGKIDLARVEAAATKPA